MYLNQIILLESIHELYLSLKPVNNFFTVQSKFSVQSANKKILIDNIIKQILSHSAKVLALSAPTFNIRVMSKWHVKIRFN